MNPTILYVIAALLAAVGIGRLAWQWWQNRPTPTPPTPTPNVETDLYPHVVALRKALTAELYNQVLVAVCGRPLVSLTQAELLSKLANEPINPNWHRVIATEGGLCAVTYSEKPQPREEAADAQKTP
jgi:hypothetical protein